MSQIVDYLSMPVSECWYFDVNTAVTNVTAVNPVGNKYVYNAQGNDVFVAGDSLCVVSLGIILPEAFTFYKDTYPFPSLTIIPEGFTSGNDFYNPNFSSGHQFIITEGFQEVTDAFLLCKDSYDLTDPTKNLMSENYRLKFDHSFFTPKISMFGAPASMHGVRFYITPFIQIEHSFPMI